jgi:hypothetical protein
MSAVHDVPFFDQLGITNVVWLDDLFDAKVEANEIDITEQVASANAAGTKLSHPKLQDLTADDSPQEWARRILERLDASERATFLAQIAPASVPSTQSDYTPGELEEVVSGLSSQLKCVGLDKWADSKEELIPAAATGVFLIDRERLVAGERTNVGDEIVRELVTRCPDDVLVVVLTHSVGPDGTEILRKTLATDLAIPPARLGIVSKRPKGVSLVSGVRAAVRVTLTQLTCTVVTGRIANVMRKSLDATEAALGELPVHALDLAVFENSFNEGASEIDVLSRILTSRQRTEVDSHIAGALDDVHSPLARMRKLRSVEAMPELPPGDASLLRQWRRDEVFDAGERLNALRAPLACGDVFQKHGTQNYFVLLGQPCDLMVRSDGQRAAREGVFVKLKFPHELTPASEGRYFEVPPLEGSDRWALDFRRWASVNLDCLEWTSFNIEGNVAFSPSPNAPTGLLPGWEKRFARARNKFKQGQTYCLSLGDIAGAATVASATSVAFPYKRVARLRGPRAAGAYAAFASFHARGAFDHDYTKGLDEKPSDDIQQPGPTAPPESQG